MKQYHKIHTVFKRDPATNMKTLLNGEWSEPEFEYLANSYWTATEKIDGTNIRIGWDGNAVTFGGRTDDAQIPTFLLAELQKWATPEAMSDLFGDSMFVLYGEGYGNKIQKVGPRYNPNMAAFALFDVLGVGEREIWLERENVKNIADKLGIAIVPILGEKQLVEWIIECRDNPPRSLMATDDSLLVEGFVLRPTVELRNRRGERIITKIKVRDFRHTE